MQFELMLRLWVLLLLGVVILIPIIYRRWTKNEYFINIQEGGWLKLALPLGAAILLLLVILLNILVPGWLGWSRINLPNWLRITGTALAPASVLWLWWVFHTLGNRPLETDLLEDSQELITSGPYSWVRHPLYAGGLLFLLSIGFVLEDWLVLAFALVGFVAFRFLVIPAEEEHLMASFGEDYESYQRRTGTLLPWIR